MNYKPIIASAGSGAVGVWENILQQGTEALTIVIGGLITYGSTLAIEWIRKKLKERKNKSPYG